MPAVLELLPYNMFKNFEGPVYMADIPRSHVSQTNPTNAIRYESFG